MVAGKLYPGLFLLDYDEHKTADKERGADLHYLWHKGVQICPEGGADLLGKGVQICPTEK